MASLLAWALILGTMWLLCRSMFTRRSHGPLRAPLPPGPKPLPLLGNILDFPPSGVVEFRHWLKHKDLYGPISSVSAMGITLVLLHDRQAAYDILSGVHSHKTAGRPHMVFAYEFCDYGKFVLTRGYNAAFRRMRKLLHPEVGSTTGTASFNLIQEVETRRLLGRMLHAPEQWTKHIKLTVSTIVLKVAYGYTVDPNRRDVLTEANELMANGISVAAVPLSWMPDIFPVLRHLPRNLPLPFLQAAKRFKKDLHTTAMTPYRFVQDQMAKGTESPSFVSKAVRKGLRDPEDLSSLGKQEEEDIIWTTVSLYTAAGDSTILTMTMFHLAMALNPHVQSKAQTEIDAVIGTNRLPSFSDRDKMPYVGALIKEILRWWPITPLGFPHQADEDVEYAGLRIPAGALIIPNVWWFLHDPDVYPDPDAFEPERFLPPRNEPEPESDAFGYGRRACAGRVFAEASLFISIVHVLAVFRITKATNKKGEDLQSMPGVKPGVLSYTDPFDVSITPRSEEHAELVRRFERQNPLEPGDSVKIHLEMATPVTGTAYLKG